MLPRTLALVDDDPEFGEFLSHHLQGLGIQTRWFADSNELLTDPAAFDFEFYVIDLMLPGIQGLDLIRVLRRRTNVGLLVVSGQLAGSASEQVVEAGADMFLAKPVRFEQIAVVVKALHRRARAHAASSQGPWTLDRRAGVLHTPDGARVELSPTDLVVLDCFVEAKGQVVTHDALRARLGFEPVGEKANDVHATIYRLRRRIERATPDSVPLESQPRQGYVFRRPLIVR